jgi:hypothetical protein
VKKLLLLLLIVSNSSFGQVWETVVESEDHNVYSYDPSSIKQDGDMVTFWEMIDYKTPMKSGKSMVLSSKTKIIQDCKNNRFKVSDMIEFDGHNGLGNMVNVTVGSNTNWYTTKLDSINEVLKEWVCK